MEQTRAQAVARLTELGRIQYPQLTARDLRRGKRPMLRRVERRTQRKHRELVELQKKKLTADIKKIDVYSQSVSSYQDYLLRKAEYDAQLLAYQESLIQPTTIETTRTFSTPIEPIQQVSLFTPIMPIAPTVLQRPTVIVRPMAVKTKTKLKKYTQRRRR